jgi:hypothetical protein
VAGSVSAVGSTGKGGEIQILGNHVDLTGSAWVDASGSNGGGTILIGGDSQGKNLNVQDAETTNVGQDVIIRANAAETGNGGKVVLWANDTTGFYGSISAKGGANGGDGGTAEVSGKQTLVYEGTTDLSAAAGKTGNLLLDPLDFTIGVDVTGANLGAMLGSANVTIQTGATGNQVGNITVSDSVSWSSTNTLTLNAYHDIDVNNAISNSGGGSLVLRADATGTGSGNVFFAGLGHVSLTGGGTASIYYNPPGGYAAPTNYAGYFSGVTPTAFMLVNCRNSTMRNSVCWTG